MDATRYSGCGRTTLPSGFPAALGRSESPEILPEHWDHRLLRSNDPPDDFEVAHIQAALRSTETHLAPLNEEISRLQEKLSRLVHRQTELTSLRVRQQGILSPLRHIPPEVLGEIFAWTLPPAHKRLEITSSPWVLTHVSRRWRAVAVDTSSLWSLVDIDFADYLTSSPVPMLETQFGRAQNLKIRFDVSYTDDGTGTGASPVSQFAALNCLVRHASRLEELSLYLHTDLIPALDGLVGNVARLRKIQFRLHEEDGTQLAHSLHCFKIAPSLVDATIYGEFTSLAALLPMHQLTRYEVEASWAAHFGALKQAHNLVEARIDINGADWHNSFPPSEEILELSNLRRLYLSHLQLLDVLKTPALETLSLWLWDDSEIDDVDKKILRSSLIQSCADLHGINLGGQFAPFIAVKVLRGIPSILDTKIIITGLADLDWTKAVLSNLTVDTAEDDAIDRDKHIIAPQLEGIHFAGIGGETFSSIFGVYLDMVKSRWDAPSCAVLTTTFGVDEAWVEDMLPDDLARVEGLRAEGLEIFLVEGTSDLTDEWSFSPDFKLD